MPTATQVIYRSLRLIGQIRPGQGASASQNNDGLATANDMLDAWSVERLNVFNVATASYPLTTATPAYLIGPGQTLNAPRPIRIERAGILIANPNGSGTIRQPLRILSEREWDAIAVKISTSPIPEKLYCDNAYPYATLNLLPIPTFSSGTAPKLELSTWTALTQFPDLTTDVEFPPAYELAIRYNLALLLAPGYPQNVADSEMARVQQVAAGSLAALRALNLTLAHDDEGTQAWQAQEPMNTPPAGPVNALEAPKQ
jgi:hypothetical protein